MPHPLIPSTITQRRDDLENGAGAMGNGRSWRNPETLVRRGEGPLTTEKLWERRGALAPSSSREDDEGVPWPR
jgi:hypothetical protein